MAGDQSMNDPRSNGEPEAPDGAPEPAEGQNGPETATDVAGRVAGLEAELADCKDRLLRAFAEQENARRRALREREEAVRFAASGLGRDLLATVDNLRRAIESVPDESSADEPLRTSRSGGSWPASWRPSARCSTRWQSTASAGSPRSASRSIPSATRRCSR
jgi:molecular chaperone GrpE (heat shock protein)